MNICHRVCQLCVWAGLLWFAGRSAPAAEPLSQRIDHAIAAAHVGPLADPANDHEFLRRLYLDLIGRTPSVDELTSFVADDTPTKRQAAIKALLQSTEFNRHFVDVLDIMFMERRGGSRIPQQEWIKFLRHAVDQNWSFDKLVRHIIAADGTGPHRGAAKFLIQREVEPNALTRDIGRIFLGRDLQCAQCHDHPNIDDYYQSDYFGIFAFVNRSYLFEDAKDNNKSYVGEKAIGDAEFKSVFEPDSDSTSATPSLSDGLTLDLETPTTGEDAYVVAPSKTVAGVPKFSRRTQLARLITHPDNEHFAQNVVNRLWAHMMGRGLVDPVDFHHGDNPPSHPDLLRILAMEFVNSGFDYRELLNQIAQSETYQRAIDFPARQPLSLAELDARSAELKAAADAITVDDRLTEFEHQLETRRQHLAAADTAVAGVIAKADELKQSITASQASIGKLNKQLAASQDQHNALQAAVAAAKQVCEHAPDDAELAAALAGYQQRATAAAKVVETTKTELEQQHKQLDELSQQRSDQLLSLAKLQGERVGLADMVAEARGALNVFRESQRLAEARREEIGRQLVALDLHRQVVVKRHRAQELSARQDQLAAAVTPLRQQLAQVVESIKPVEAAIAKQQAVLVNAQQLVTASTATIDQQQQSLAELSGAIAQAEVAATDLDDDQIRGAVAVLKDKQSALDEKIAVAQRQLAAQQQELTAADANLKQQQARQSQLIAKQTEVQSQISEREASWQAAVAAADSAQADVAAADRQLRESWERRYVVRSLVPLTPEQLAGATINALELRPRFEHEAEAEWQKNNKDKSAEQIDEATKRNELAALIDKRIKAVHQVYVSMFAAPGGSPQDVFSATADQALFIANDSRFQDWLVPAAGSLLHRLQSITDNNELAAAMYLAIHSRPAADEERQAVAKYLESRPDQRNEAIRELAWGLLSSLEFRFNR